MKVDGRHTRSIWLEPDGWSVAAIDQRRLPHEFVVDKNPIREGLVIFLKAGCVEQA